MADNSSIATRMQKLAKLKRRQSGDNSDDAPVSGDVAAPEADVAEEESAPILMPGPVADYEEDPDALSAFMDDHEDSAPELGGVNDTVAAAEPEVAEAAAAPERPKTRDTDGDSLDDYFAALGMESDGDAEDASADVQTDAVDPVVETTQEAEADDVLDEINLGTIDDDPSDDVDDILAAAEAAEAGAADEATTANETPDFTMAEIDPETLAREFEGETAATEEDGIVTISFDESRSTLLSHVSRQMNCSVEDVVVTALDWYLDALFGEDEQKIEATG